VACQAGSGPTTTTSVTTTTTTTPPLCGNNVVDDGEDCDPPGSLSCPSSSPEGSFTECSEVCTCAGGPVTTTTTTTTPPPVCGNGILEDGEQCDPPGTDTCPPDSPGGAFTTCLENCICANIVTTTTTTEEPPTATTTTVTTT